MTATAPIANSAPSPWTAAKPYLALFGGMLSLATGTSFAKTLFPQVGAEGTSALRVGLAAVMLTLFWRPWRFKLDRAGMKAIGLYGLVLGLMNLSFYISLKTIPLGIALAIEFMGPLSLALIHARKWIHGLWVLCAAIGLVLLLPLGGAARTLDPLGCGLAALAGLFWALYIVFGKKLGAVHPGQSVALGMAIAALIIVPVGVAKAGPALFHPAILVAGLFVAACSSALPYSLEMIALRAIPKRTFGVVVSVEPVIGALAGLIVLHEQLSGRQWLAVATIVVASAGAILTMRDTPKAEPAA